MCHFEGLYIGIADSMSLRRYKRAGTQNDRLDKGFPTAWHIPSTCLVCAVVGATVSTQVL